MTNRFDLAVGKPTCTCEEKWHTLGISKSSEGFVTGVSAELHLSVAGDCPFHGHYIKEAKEHEPTTGISANHGEEVERK